jgi:pyruvate formate-lyase activating enzyme-like uncharacterized protein
VRLLPAKYVGNTRRFELSLQKDAWIHQHLYTNGTLAAEETLKALGEAGLNEIHFNTKYLCQY